VRRLPRNRTLRAVSAALVVVALAAQLASFAHLVLVRHVTCAEHGEMIEVGHDDEAAATTTRTDVTGLAASSLDSHGHDHCLLVPMRRDRAGIGLTRSFDSVHVDAYGTIGVRHESISPAIAVLRIAPKNSPPIA
jgi:hypothetical protein